MFPLVCHRAQFSVQFCSLLSTSRGCNTLELMYSKRFVLKKHKYTTILTVTFLRTILDLSINSCGDTDQVCQDQAAFLGALISGLPALLLHVAYSQITFVVIFLLFILVTENSQCLLLLPSQASLLS